MKGYTTAGVVFFVRSFFWSYPPLFFAGRKEQMRLIRVNGEELPLAGQTLLSYLEEASYDLARIAVECNGEIVPKRVYGETVLKDGDVLEIVSFVGGG